MALCSSNVTSGFVDLATYDEPEKYLYGGSDATAYFVRETRKSTWFTMVPVILSRASGSPAFGQEWSAQISRAGDYLLQTWLRVTTPAVTLRAAGTTYGANGRIRWTRNFMHNLIRECCLTFNDLVAARFDNYHLDFWAAFTVPAGKRNGYNNMIGNFNDMTGPHGSTTSLGDTIPSFTLNLPLPFFYGRDSGVALPTAALPYNDMRINFSFRDWEDLLVLDNSGAAGAGTAARAVPVAGSATTGDLSTGIPTLARADVWANYAIVSNNERSRMACAPRDILIEQVQTAPRQSFTPSTNSQQQFDLRFSHAIKVIFFAVRNSTWRADWSNYTTASPYNNGGDAVNFTPSGAADPILQTSLIYENTNRLAAMGSDFFSLVNPFFHAPVVPLETGYHSYSYSLDFICCDPLGSTNYGKLTNVLISPEASTSAVTGAAGSGAAGSGVDFAQRYEFVCTVVNNNVIENFSGDKQATAHTMWGKQCNRLVACCA